MRPRPFSVERWRGRPERMMQQTIDAHRAATASASERNRRLALAEAAREDLRENLAGLGMRDAALYVGELRALLNGEPDLAGLMGGAA
jgi:hypothetical protein